MTGKPCDYYESNVKNKQMFIVSPFGFPFDSLYKDEGEIQLLLEKKCDLSKAQRSDQTMRLGSVMCQGICKEIIENQYLYADISLPNPNVYYELGLAYALSRDIVVTVNTTSSNPYLDIFERAWSQKKTFIQYSSLSTLREAIEKIDISTPITLQSSDHSCDNSAIAILENGDGGISMIYESLLKKIQGDFKFDTDSIKILTESEKESFEESRWKNWQIKTLRINKETTLDTITAAIAHCKVCIVDTTAYKTQTGSITNPYMYFCLGIAHGFEKEVIPVTNALHSSIMPFDVKGLWHIFFAKEEELMDGLSKIIPRISIEFHKEISNAPYQKIWDGFLFNKQTLSVIYCGRPTGSTKNQIIPNSEKRGSRTNIDSWDTKAVSEVSFYLAQKYPTSLIKPTSPKTKMVTYQEVKVTEIKEQLSDIYSNCIIVGSPDVNDYAEIVLAKLYGVKPFDPEAKTDKKGGFIFYKNNIHAPINSSFYRKDNNSNWVQHPGGIAYCTQNITFGVLTIATNPFVKNRLGKIIVLSGFTGLATCALMELVIESEPEPNDAKEKLFKKALNKQLKEQILVKFKAELKTPFSAIIRFEYETESAENIVGDNRSLRDVLVLQCFS